MAEKKLSAVYVSWPKPDFEHAVKTHKQFRRNFYGAMQYVHYELSAVELKREVVKYLKIIDPVHPFLERIKNMHENRFITVGKYMYLLNHGCDIPDDFFGSLMPTLEKVINEEEARQAAAEKAASDAKKDAAGEPSIPVKAIVSIQDRIKDRAKEAAGEVEGWLDEFICDKKQSAKTVEEFVNLYKTFDLKAPHMRYIQNIFEKRAEEISNVVSSADKDLLEAYSNFTKPELKKLDTFHKNLLKACDMLQEVSKIERAPRIKKPVSTDKLVAKLKYKKDDKALGIVSLNPSQIIGSTIVWVFDVKTRKLTKYVADDIAGPLSVKGASIIGVNQAKSTSKTLRSPAIQLAEFKKCGKVQLRTFMDTITTVGISPTGKINENQIILKVM